MTDTTVLAGGSTNDITAIIEVAQAAAEPDLLDADHPNVYGHHLPEGAHYAVTDLEKYASAPRRKRGTVRFTDAPSLIAYLAKHGRDETELYADLDARTVTAVLDAHGADTPAWGQHRAILAVKTTPAWDRWAARDRRIEGQVAFAEHLEDSLPDLVDPSGAHMLEVAQSFKAATKVSFESSKRLTSGEVGLEYREEVDTKAGRKGDIAIPATFTLALVPFIGSDPFKVTARLRYRIDGGQLRIGYVLDRPEDVLREAFEDVRKVVAEGTGRAAWLGSPS